MSNETIKKKLVVEDGFSQAFEDYGRGVSGVGKASEKANPSISKTEKAMASASKSVVGFVAAYVSLKGLGIAKDLGNASAEAEAVEKSFSSMSIKVGSSLDSMMGKMRNATDNMVDDMTLQQSAMKALQAGIDPDAMITSMKYVSRYALSIGADANQLMQTVMTGLARGSAEFLDDVGIQVMGSADVVGDTIDQMNAKMLEKPEGALTNIKQYRTEAENLKKELGENLVPALELWERTQLRIFTALKGAVDNVKLLRDQDPWEKQIWKLERVKQLLEESKEIIDRSGPLTLGEGAQIRDNTKEIKSITGESIRVRDLGRINSLLINQQVTERRNSQERIKAAKELKAENEKIAASYKKMQDEEKEAEALKESNKKAEKERIAKAKLDKANAAKEELKRIANIQKAKDYGLSLELDTLKRTAFGREEALEQERYLQEKYISDSKISQEEKVRFLLSLNTEYGLRLDDMRATELEKEQLASDERIRISEFEAENKKRLLEEERTLRANVMAESINLVGELANLGSTMSEKRLSYIQREYDKERQSINDSTKSKKDKEKALKKLDKERESAEIAQQERNARWATLQAATNYALTLQASALAVVRASAETSGNVWVKLAAGVTMAAATVGFIAQSASAMDSIPNRYNGGSVRKGGMYEVAENGKTEMLEENGKKYLIPGSDGRITPNSQINNNSGGNKTYNINIAGGGGDSSSTADAVVRAIEMADTQGSIDWGGMKNLQQSVRS